MSLTPIDTVIFVAFIATVVAVGLLKSRHERDSESYFLAGRALSGWVIGISLIAANISTEQFVGMTGQAAGYQGLAPASYDWIAAISLVLIAFFFLPYFLRSGIYTMPEFLEKRYNRWARLIMALCTVPMLVLLAACVIYAGALLLLTFSQGGTLLGMLPINLTTGAWLLGMIAAVYVTSGGLKACAWADVIQGTALIIGGLLITWFAFARLGDAPVDALASQSDVPVSLADSAGPLEKFAALNGDKLHMVLPREDPNIPWTALLFGLWIPNLYYWGLNQYITQRTLGSKSLAEGQKGIVLAAAMQVILPMILVVPGLIGFNLFAPDMLAASGRDNAPVLAAYAKANPNSRLVEVVDWPDSKSLPARRPDQYLLVVCRDADELAAASASGPRVLGILKSDFDRIDVTGNYLVFKSDDRQFTHVHPALAAEMDRYNRDVEQAAAAASRKVTVEKLIAYKYDTAFGLLCGKVLPRGLGLQGFVMAAILGAIVSSLAAMLNAASTIFTIDFVRQYLHPAASPLPERAVVAVGRTCVIVFAVLACLVAPMLGDPKISSSIFRLIQELQGYISPGILAVFVFGLASRRAPGWTGVAGLLVNPILYFSIGRLWPGVPFLDRMAICFTAVVLLMAVARALWPTAEPVVFETSTSIGLESSPAAKIVGTVVVVVTLALYVIFW